MDHPTDLCHAARALPDREHAAVVALATALATPGPGARSRHQQCNRIGYLAAGMRREHLDALVAAAERLAEER